MTEGTAIIFLLILGTATVPMTMDPHSIALTLLSIALILLIIIPIHIRELPSILIITIIMGIIHPSLTIIIRPLVIIITHPFMFQPL